MRIPRQVTEAVRQIAVGLIEEEAVDGTGLSEDLRDTYGDGVVEEALRGLADRLAKS